MELELLESEDEIRHLVEHCQTCDWISIDTEFMRYRTYYPVLCLIQLHSTFGTFGIDALRIKNIQVLNKLFKRKETTVIMHACDQDLEALSRRAKFQLNGLFDTQIAAAFCGYTETVGYSSIVYELCGVVLEKDQTKSDWSNRPLTHRQLEYAKNDVLYLDNVRKILESRMEQSGKLEWFLQDCREIAKLALFPVSPEHVYPNFSNIDVPNDTRGIARELIIWRERQAQMRDRPRKWILSNQAIVDLCHRRPKKFNQLWHISSLSKNTIKSIGPVLIEMIRKHEEEHNNTNIPEAIQLDEQFKKSVKEAKKMVHSIAREQGISHRLLGSRKDVELLIRGESKSKLMKGWRYDLIGKAMKDRFG
ncbi:MAG: HRDC domain-containing protein [Gammaproteobacteria bacterium]|nr:HRDC domain-containing protein [Gammaproteobacteria bacterium]